MIVQGKDLKVGDTIEVWWTPKRDTITALRPYTGPLERLAGARLADFALNTTGMTIEANDDFVVLNGRSDRVSDSVMLNDVSIRDRCDPAFQMPEPGLRSSDELTTADSATNPTEGPLP